MQRIGHILAAVDSFKGSMTARRACLAIAEGVARLDAGIETTCLPMADGGEGTVEALTTATGGRLVEMQATGPLGEPTPAFYGLLGSDGGAVVEMAAASGLPLVPESQRNPLRTTSYGTGELIAAALDSGAGRLIVCIGGSATTDLGAGMLQALGVRFLTADKNVISEKLTGGRLREVASVDLSGLHPGVGRCAIEVACDVSNPLLGERGAAAVFGPQKGASPDDVIELERNLAHLADLLEAATGHPVRDLPGAGAAGGLGAALAGVLGARLREGVKIVLEAVGFAQALENADLVITGEGRIDATTLHGKTIAGICAAAAAAGKPVAALAGQVADREQLAPLGLVAAAAIAPPEIPTAEAMARGEELLAEAAEKLIAKLSN